MGYADHILRISSQHTNHILIKLKHRGITLRHLAFASGILVFLWTSYFTLFSDRVNSLDLPSEAVVSPNAVPSSLPGPEAEHSRPIRPEVDPTKEEWHSRAEQVKAAFMHTWRAYEENAWGFDEIRPTNGDGINKYASIRV